MRPFVDFDRMGQLIEDTLDVGVARAAVEKQTLPPLSLYISEQVA